MDRTGLDWTGFLPLSLSLSLSLVLTLSLFSLCFTSQTLHKHVAGPSHVLVSDTSSEAEWRERLEGELQKSDVVVVCYKAGSPRSLSRVGTYWLPELRHMQVDKPIILVGCKEDLSNSEEPENNTMMMQGEFRFRCRF